MGLQNDAGPIDQLLGRLNDQIAATQGPPGNGQFQPNSLGGIFNPNTPQTGAVADAISPFLQALFGGGSNPFGAMASPLQQQAVGNIQTFLGMPAPETRALGQSWGAISGLLNNGPMQNPFGGGDPNEVFGGVSAGQQVVNAAQPVFNQNLQGALTQVANRAPSVRNAAFGDQASGLAQRALGDFNLFTQQALQQGQQLDLQNALTRQSLGQQFALGAGQLQQQGQLGGLSALGSLSQAAGQNPFARMLGAGQLGAQFTQGNVNPLLQLMLGGMQFGQQNPLEMLVRQQQQSGSGLGALAGGVLGSFLGPVGSAAGTQLGGRLFG